MTYLPDVIRRQQDRCVQASRLWWRTHDARDWDRAIHEADKLASMAALLFSSQDRPVTSTGGDAADGLTPSRTVECSL